MSIPARTIFLGAAALAASAQLSAQPQGAAPQPPTAAPSYSSAFEDYRPFAPVEVQDWRKSNDTAREIGGWRAYAREISGSTAPAGQAPAPNAQPKAADPHQGHRK